MIRRKNNLKGKIKSRPNNIFWIIKKGLINLIAIGAYSFTWLAETGSIRYWSISCIVISFCLTSFNIISGGPGYISAGFVFILLYLGFIVYLDNK